MRERAWCLTNLKWRLWELHLKAVSRSGGENPMAADSVNDTAQASSGEHEVHVSTCSWSRS